MDTGYTYVKEWRKRVRKALVAAFGGQCGLCGYSRCIEALDLHHLNAADKNMTLSSWATAASFAKLADEARKCILVCACCHREIHAKVATTPSTIRRFDHDAYIEAIRSLTIERRNDVRARRVGAKIPQRQFARKRVNWDQIDLIGMRAVGLSLAAIAKNMGVSKSAVQKRLRNSGV